MCGEVGVRVPSIYIGVGGGAGGIPSAATTTGAGGGCGAEGSEQHRPRRRWPPVRC